jgi:hypothetical protein
MRLSIFAAAIAASIGLAACATPSGPYDPNAPIAGATLVDERAMGMAVTAAHGADLAAEIAVDAGLLKGANAAKVADALDAAHTAIGAANAAYILGDAATYNAKVDAARNLIERAIALTPKK